MEIRLTGDGMEELGLQSSGNLADLAAIDDSDRMYLAISLTVVDAEGKVLMTVNCRHERQWTIAGFCNAGRGLARCVDCGAYFHGGTWDQCQCAPFPSSAFVCRKCQFSTLTPSFEECVEGGTCEWIRR